MRRIIKTEQLDKEKPKPFPKLRLKSKRCENKKSSRTKDRVQKDSEEELKDWLLAIGLEPRTS